MFDQVVFAGGGNRCWWQAGFWDVVQPELELKPRIIAGISAGAATACMLYTNQSRWVMDYYARAQGQHEERLLGQPAARRAIGVSALPHLSAGAARHLRGAFFGARAGAGDSHRRVASAALARREKRGSQPVSSRTTSKNTCARRCIRRSVRRSAFIRNS